MPDHARTLRRIQIGKETTPGTLVAAGKRLLASRPEGPEAVTPTRKARGGGIFAPVNSVIGKRMSQMSVQGPIGYGDLMYWLAMCLKQPSTASGVHTFTMSESASHTIDTCTIEAGSAIRAEKFGYCFVSDLRLEFGTEECSCQAAIVGRTQSEGATLTGSPTDIPSVIVGPAEWGISEGSPAGSPTYSALTWGFNATVQIRNRWAPIFSADASQGSFNSIVEAPNEDESPATISLTVSRDSGAVSQLTYLASQATRMIKIAATSATAPHALTIEMPVRWEGTPRRTSVGGVESVTLEGEAFYDSSFGTWLKVVLTNGLTGL